MNYTKSAYAIVAVNIWVREVPASQNKINIIENTAVKSAIQPRSLANVFTVERIVMAAVGRRHAVTVATKDTKRII
jgi:hypothetical protein